MYHPMTPTECYHCGNFGTILVDDGSSVICDECEENYQQALRAEFPYGQCQQCGAVYKPFTCEQNVTHVDAFHAEGACSMWRDGGETVDDAAIQMGWCSYGCHPTDFVQATDLPYADSELPF